MHTEVWTNCLKLSTKQLYEVWHKVEDSSMMNGVAKSTTVGRQLLLIGPPSWRRQADVNFAAMSRWRAKGGLPPKQHAELMAGQRRVDIMLFFQFKQRNANDMCWCLLTLCFKKTEECCKLTRKAQMNDKHVHNQGWRDWIKFLN